MVRLEYLRQWSERSHRLLIIAMALILLLAGTQRRAVQARKKAPAATCLFT